MQEMLEASGMQEWLQYSPSSVELSLREYDQINVALIDLTKPTFLLSLASFAFAPLFWNSVARFEYKTKLITKLFCGARVLACYCLALCIFSLQLERDFMFNAAMDEQPYFVEASAPVNQIVCYLLFLVGSTLVLSSFWALGITGTYLGDHFGILMKERVTGFPFNVCENPMYTGSVMNLLAGAMWKGSPAGVVLTLWAQIVYYIAVKYFEGPFTTMIYTDKAAEDEAALNSGKKSSSKRKNKKKNQ